MVVCIYSVDVAESAVYYFVFFFNDTATTEIYTLSLHDALPISGDISFMKYNQVGILILIWKSPKTF